MNTSHQIQSCDENSEVLSGSESDKDSSRPPLSESDIPAAGLGNALSAATEQLCLFPLLPFGPSEPIRVHILDWPCAAIARVMVVVLDGHRPSFGDSDTCWLRYLAVTADRTYLAKGTITFSWQQIEAIDPFPFPFEMFMETLVADIANQRGSHIALPEDWSFDPAPDSLDWFLNPTNWRSCSQPSLEEESECSTSTRYLKLEADAAKKFSDQIAEAVLRVVSKLAQPFQEVVVARRKIGYSAVYRVLTVAREMDLTALRYAVQLLLNQSLCLIDYLCKETQVLQLKATLSGSSVRRIAYKHLGWSAGVYRRSVACPKRASPLLDFPIAAADLGALLPLANTMLSMWPKVEDGQQFFDALFLLHDLAMPMDELSTVLKWCVADYRNCYIRVIMLIEKGMALASTAGLAGLPNMLEPGAINLAFGLVKSRKRLQLSEIEDLLDPNDVVGNVMTVSEHLGKSVDELAAAVLGKHPGTPDRFGWAPYKIRSLNSVAAATKHGDACRVCLGDDQATVVDYVAGGVALYGIESWTGKCLGTIGLVLDDSTDPAHVEVWQVSGVTNRPVPPVLLALAEALAISSGDDKIARARWLDWANATRDFRRAASLARE